MLVMPLRTRPSVGTWSPFRTLSLSPTLSVETSTISTVPSSFISLALVGLSLIKLVISFLLLFSAYSSK